MHWEYKTQTRVDRDAECVCHERRAIIYKHVKWSVTYANGWAQASLALLNLNKVIWQAFKHIKWSVTYVNAWAQESLTLLNLNKVIWQTFIHGNIYPGFPHFNSRTKTAMNQKTNYAHVCGTVFHSMQRNTAH